LGKVSIIDILERLQRKDEVKGRIMALKIRLGSRGSALAMVQARLVQSMLAAATSETIEAFPIQSFTTTGDRVQDRPLLEVGGKGLFTKELDEALLDRRIDAAVHSMKDLPTVLPPGLVLACVPCREDPRDAFICASVGDLMALPPGAIVGTASLRRQAQTLNLRPDLRVSPLRGSVQTRLKRLAEGRMDATFLAVSGLTRMGLADTVAGLIPVDLMPPAAGQGALAVVCRVDDRATLEMIRPLNSAAHDIETTAERAFLDVLDGSCRTPIGALARVERDSLTFIGELLTPGGTKRWRRTATIALDADPHAAGDALGRRLAADIRTEARAAYHPGPIAVTAWRQ
jgi:hydroxymethylbilane synthase